LKIEVRRDDLVKGSIDNPSPTVFAEFSSAIHEYLTRRGSARGVRPQQASEVRDED